MSPWGFFLGTGRPWTWEQDYWIVLVIVATVVVATALYDYWRQGK